MRGIDGLQPRTPKGFYLPVGGGLRLDFPGRRCARMSHSSGVGQTACLVIGFAERCFEKLSASWRWCQGREASHAVQMEKVKSRTAAAAADSSA